MILSLIRTLEDAFLVSAYVLMIKEEKKVEVYDIELNKGVTRWPLNIYTRTDDKRKK